MSSDQKRIMMCIHHLKKQMKGGKEGREGGKKKGKKEKGKE